MAELVLDVCLEYGIATRLGYFIMDNAANNTTMLEVLAESLPSIDPTEHRVRCLAHVINLSAKTLLKSLDSAPATEFDLDSDANPDGDGEIDLAPAPGPVAKLSFCVHYIRRSPLRRAEYRAAVEDLDLPDATPTLVSDNDTRFNSVCNMIRSALPAQMAIDQFMFEEQYAHPANSKIRKNLHKNLLLPDDWHDLDILYGLLRPFELCTLATEGIPPSASLTDFR
jgi:hypothetical protein